MPPPAGSYEKTGFVPIPVVNYFRSLADSENGE